MKDSRPYVNPLRGHLIFGIIFVAFYIILRNVIMPDIKIEFYSPLILGIVIHLIVVRRLNLISDSLIPKVGELRKDPIPSTSRARRVIRNG
ncbi:hypothetical protein DRP07_01830 [Archaeoglobales archaeon]|nr:MAG: hypothetical protein DRP07_01830 [Archaeoglobales archaeon]